MASGQVVGLLGHNGAGKTTLVHQVVGLVLPDAGSITLDGIDAVAHPELARERTSIQAQANVPITGLTSRAAIELIGRIRGGSKPAMRRRADELIEALDLGPWAAVTAEKVSGGVARLTAVTASPANGTRGAAVVPAHAAADVVRWAQGEVEAGRIERYALTPASLEDVYVDLVGHEKNGGHENHRAQVAA